MTRTLATPLALSSRSTGSVASLARRWIAAARERRALARLAPEHLADIGVAPDSAAAEASRPFWDAPTGWR